MRGYATRPTPEKLNLTPFLPMPVAASVCGRSLAGIVGSNPSGSMDVCLLLSVVCCQVVSASGRSLIQRCSTENGVSVTVKPRQ